jgi:L-ascorbate metabolism protein UlaG (beta-lactamase superfamily)
MDMGIQHDNLSFERLGHASVRIETDNGLIVYIDPWSDVIHDSPHDGDLVFVTHDDYDHYDPDGIEAVASEEANIVTYEAIDTSDLDRDVTPLSYDGSLTVQGITVEAVPAHNRNDGDHTRDNGTPYHQEGEVIGLVLEFDAVTVYFPSDTDFLPVHETVQANVFIPPIGGHYTMNRHEAVDFAESVDADLVLPVHYDTFEAIETDEEAFVTDLEERGRSVELF